MKGKTQGQPRTNSGKFEKKQPKTDLTNMTEKEYNDYHDKERNNFILMVKQEIENGYNDIERITKAYLAITRQPFSSVNVKGMKSEIMRFKV